MLCFRAEALNIPVPELKGVNFTPTQRYKLEKEKVAVLEKENSKLRVFAWFIYVLKKLNLILNIWFCRLKF